MKRKIFISLGMVLAVSLLWAGAAQAIGARNGDVVSVGKDEVVDSTLYAAGKTILVAGTVKGDVFCAGQMVEVSGTVEGDVLCASQEVRITGQVQGDVRTAGQNVVVTGMVQGSLTAFGQSVTLENGTKVGRDVTAFGQNTRIAGEAARDVTAGGDTVTLAGMVGRNATLKSENVTLQSSARVGGNLEYTSRNDARIEQGASIAGKTERKEPPREERKQPTTAATVITGIAYKFLALFLLGAVLLLLLPRFLGDTVGTMRTHVLGSFGAGIVALIATPILAVILLFTIVGIPLALMLLGLWLIALFASFVFTAFAVGVWLTEQFKWPPRWVDITALAIGALALVIATRLPIVGGIVGFLALVWGLGGVVFLLGQHIGRQRPVQKKSARA